jgi:hypothetical protein
MSHYQESISNSALLHVREPPAVGLHTAYPSCWRQAKLIEKRRSKAKLAFWVTVGVGLIVFLVFFFLRAAETCAKDCVYYPIH